MKQLERNGRRSEKAAQWLFTGLVFKKCKAVIQRKVVWRTISPDDTLLIYYFRVDAAVGL